MISLNWTPEVIIDMIVSAVVLAGAIIMTCSYVKQKLLSLFLIGLVWYAMAAFFLMEAISLIFLDLVLGTFYALVLFVTAVMIRVCINYSKQEGYFSPDLIVIITLGSFLTFFAFWPGVAEIVVQEGGVEDIIWTGAYQFLGIFFQDVTALYFFYWAYITWRNAPFELRHETWPFVIGAVLLSPVAVLAYAFTAVASWAVLISDAFVMTGASMISFAIIKNPKIMYILPFILHHVGIKLPKSGDWYVFEWSEPSIDEEGFKSQVETLTKLMARDGWLQVTSLGQELSILRSNQATIAVLASRSSRMLKRSMGQLMDEITRLVNTDMDKRSIALLIDRHFSLYPSRIIGKKRTLAISQAASAPEINASLQQIFKTGQEIDFIKEDVQKSPDGAVSDFLSLYDEIKDEKDEQDDEIHANY